MRQEITKIKALVDENLCDEAIQLFSQAISSDLEGTLTWIKREKVFLLPRSKGTFCNLEAKALEASKRFDPVASEAVNRLLREHRYILMPFWHIQDQLDALTIWKTPRRQAILSFLIYLESGWRKLLFDQELNLPADKLTNLIDERVKKELQILHTIQGSERRILDAGLNAINEILYRCPNIHIKYGNKYEPNSFRVLVELEIQRGVLQGLADRYAYFDWSLQVNEENRLSLKLLPSDVTEYEMMVRASRRNVAGDWTSFAENLKELVDEFSQQMDQLLPIAFKNNEMQISRLLHPLPGAWEQQLNRLCVALSASTDVPQAYAAYLKDIEKTSERKFEQLVKAWHYLTRVCWLHDLAINLARKKKLHISRRDLVITVNWAEMVEAFATYSGLGKETAASVLSDLSISVVNPPTRVDIFLNPIIKLSNSFALISPAYVLNSRHIRNIMKIMATKYNFNPQEIGPIFVEFLRQAFKKAGFHTSPPYPLQIYGADGDLVTDIDLAAFKDRHLFIIEVRTHTLPDSVAETYWAKDKILDAVANVQLGCRFAQSNIIDIIKWMGLVSLSPNDIDQIQPMVVTNLREFSGIKYNGVPITDEKSLVRLLEKPFIRIMMWDPIRSKFETGMRKQLIAGTQVSGTELRDFLEHPYWLDFTGTEIGSIMVSIQVGETTISMPSIVVESQVSDHISEDA